MNKEHILTPDEFYDVARPYIEKAPPFVDEEQMKKIAGLTKRTEVLTEIPGKISFLQNYPIMIFRYMHKNEDRFGELLTLKGRLPERSARFYIKQLVKEGIKELAAN